MNNSHTAADRGRLYLWPSVELPLGDWPDLLEDIATACNIIVDRMEQSYDRLNHHRSKWLSAVKNGKTDPQFRKEGSRLGLPVDRGEVWAVAWNPSTNRDAKQTRLKMLAEDISLDLLDSPFIVLGDGIGVLLLNESARIKPAYLRDELLKVFGPDPLWLVHGAVYNSFEELEGALVQSVNAIQRARREDDERYISEVHSKGLDSLLYNPKFSHELSAFANNLLEPVLAHDEEHGTQLAETLCLFLTSSSTEEAAKRLFVHANTVRYRTRRAEQILDRDLTQPKERTAASLAAFLWLNRNSAMFD